MATFPDFARRDANTNRVVGLNPRRTRACREIFVAKSNEILHESIIRSMPQLIDDSAVDRVV